MDIRFKIESIETERRIDGNSIINASAIHNGDKVLMQTVVKTSDLADRDLIREQLMDCYKGHTECIIIKPISVGDFI